MGYGLAFANDDLLWGSLAYGEGVPGESPPGTIGGWDSATGVVTTVAMAGQALDLASDGVSVYWIDNGQFGQYSILKESLAGSAITTLASSILNVPVKTYPIAIAIDATSVYWTTGAGVTKLTPR